MEHRPHPMMWQGEEAPTGPFLGGSDGPNLLEIPAGVKPRGLGRLPDIGTEGAPVARLLNAVLERLKAPDGGPSAFDASGLDEGCRRLLDDALGEGEVSVIVTGGAEYQIQESVLTGVWRIKTFDPLTGRALGDHVEVAEVPSLVRAAAEEATVEDIPIGEPPPGAMNVLPVLAEVRERAAAWRPGEPNHVISFTLLPMTPADMEFLKATLGVGPVQVISSGYGTCRVTLTGRRRVWSVQYLNVMDTVILDTLEIGDVPVSVRAAAEDFEDSAVRLAEILEAYFA